MLEARDLAAGTGREGAMEMLNPEGIVSGRPWARSGRPRVKRSSNRSPDLYSRTAVLFTRVAILLPPTLALAGCGSRLSPVSTYAPSLLITSIFIPLYEKHSLYLQT